MIEVICLNCRVKFKNYPSNKPKFCSRQCFYDYKKRLNKNKRTIWLKKEFNKLGYNPSEKDLIRIGRRDILNTCNYYFGSINKAKEQLGLKINLRGGEFQLPRINMDENLGYIIGVCLGDGVVYDKKRNYKVILCVKDKEFRDYFSSIIKRITKKRPKKYKIKNYFCTYLYSKQFVILLKKYLNDLSWIDNVSDEIKKSILRGLFDSEGTVSKRKRLVFYNTNIELHKLFIKLCNTFDIHPHTLLLRTLKSGKNYYGTFIHRKKEVENFYKKIGITIERKKKRLEGDGILE